MSEIHGLVLAELRKHHAAALVKLESVRAAQRTIPSLIGKHSRQLALQKQAKEWGAQADAWDLLIAYATSRTAVAGDAGTDRCTARHGLADPQQCKLPMGHGHLCSFEVTES